MSNPYLWMKDRKNAATSKQLFPDKTFQVGSQFSFFRKANHQWLCLRAKWNSTLLLIGRWTMPPLTQSLSEMIHLGVITVFCLLLFQNIVFYAENNTSLILHCHKSAISMRNIIFCFNIIYKCVCQSQHLTQNFLVLYSPVDGAESWKLRKVGFCCQPQNLRPRARHLYETEKNMRTNGWLLSKTGYCGALLWSFLR